MTAACGHASSDETRCHQCALCATCCECDGGPLSLDQVLEQLQEEERESVNKPLDEGEPDA